MADAGTGKRKRGTTSLAHHREPVLLSLTLTSNVSARRPGFGC